MTRMEQREASYPQAIGFASFRAVLPNSIVHALCAVNHFARGTRNLITVALMMTRRRLKRK